MAVIKIEADGTTICKPVTLGNSDELRVGDWIFAIGNPFGLEQHASPPASSAPRGATSARAATTTSSRPTPRSTPATPAGRWSTCTGEVVGINTAIFSRSGGNIGIGFAIPINLAKELLPQLQEKGKVTRGWLGVYIQKVTPEIAESLRLEELARRAGRRRHEGQARPPRPASRSAT